MRNRTAQSLVMVACAHALVACSIERNPAPQVAISDSSQGEPVPPNPFTALPSVEPELSVTPCATARKGMATVQDIGEYQNMTGGGRVGSLYLDTVFVDSVDVDFGVHCIGGDSLLFLPVRGDDFDRHVLYDGAVSIKLAPRLPYLNDGFSSPGVERSRLHYWGLKKLSESGYAIYAMRFDFARSRLDSLLLDTGQVATDYRFHFAVPRPAGDSVVYRSPFRTYTVDSAYQRVVRKAIVLPPPT